MNNIIKTYVSSTGYTETGGAGNVMVNTPDVIIKGITVPSDLIIGESVGANDATLDAVNVNVSMVIRGGGANSIYAKNGSKLGKVVIANNNADLLKMFENSTTESSTFFAYSFSFISLRAADTSPAFALDTYFAPPYLQTDCGLWTFREGRPSLGRA